MTEVNSLWIGSELSLVERLCVESFLKNNTAFNLYTYDYVANVPSGTNLLDANQIIPKELIFKSNGSYAHFADWFRWKLLYLYGGTWVDMDMIACREFSFDEDIIFGLQNRNVANISVLKFPKNHSISKFFADMSEHPNKWLFTDSLRTKLRKTRRFIKGNHRSNISWGEVAGPRGFTKELKAQGIFHLGKPYTWFYFISWDNWNCIFDNTFQYPELIEKEVYGIHLWHDRIKREPNFQPEKDFHEMSLFNYFLNKYDVRDL